MFSNNGNSPERDASWMTLDYVEKQLKAATDELEEDHQRASHAYAVAEDGSPEQERAYQDRKAAHHECMGMYKARIIIARAYAFDPAKAAREDDWRATTHHVPIIYDDADDYRPECYRCNEQPATHVTIDAELLCGDCRPVTAHSGTAV